MVEVDFRRITGRWGGCCEVGTAERKLGSSPNRVAGEPCDIGEPMTGVDIATGGGRPGERGAGDCNDGGFAMVDCAVIPCCSGGTGVRRGMVKLGIQPPETTGSTEDSGILSTGAT